MDTCICLTRFLHDFFEVREVVALGDSEIPVGVLVLRDAVRWVRRADGEHTGRAIRPLLLPQLINLKWRCVRAAGSSKRQAPIDVKQVHEYELMNTLLWWLILNGSMFTCHSGDHRWRGTTWPAPLHQRGDHCHCPTSKAGSSLHWDGMAWLSTLDRNGFRSGMDLELVKV